MPNKKDWKTTATKNRAARTQFEVDQMGEDSNLVSTQHHKIPKSLLDTMYTEAELAASQGNKEAQEFIDTSGTINQLKNMEAILMPGPPPELRNDDPGAGMDLFQYNDGSLTPRSAKSQQLADEYATKDWAAMTQTVKDLHTMAEPNDAERARKALKSFEINPIDKKIEKRNRTPSPSR